MHVFFQKFKKCENTKWQKIGSNWVYYRCSCARIIKKALTLLSQWEISAAAADDAIFDKTAAFSLPCLL
jgi:hypothetical protein